MIHYKTLSQTSKAGSFASAPENERGAILTAAHDRYFGRRIEADRTWTVYHVFSGVPAAVGGALMTRLSRTEATAGMLSLNSGQDLRHAAVTTSVQS